MRYPPFKNKRIFNIYELIAIQSSTVTNNKQIYVFKFDGFKDQKQSDNYSCYLYIDETWCANGIITKLLIRYMCIVKLSITPL